LGRPGLVFLRGLERKPRETLPAGPAWARRVGSFITHPVFAGILMVAITIAWHIPSIFKAAMGSPVWHEIENASFLASGVLFWWPVILPWPSKMHWPRWTVPLYLLVSDMPVSVLSAYLAFCGYVVYPAYLTVSRPFPISPLNDQVAAAMLMWVVMLVAFLVAAVAVILEVLDPSWGHVLEIDESSRLPRRGFRRPVVARESAIGPGADAPRSVGSEGPA
jgi:putative membrane protein